MIRSPKQLKSVFSAQLCFFMIGLFCVSTVASAASVYSEIDKATEQYDELEQLHSQAFSAYLDEDYQTAFDKWRMAAKKKHAKSLFNLGLMHDRGQVPNGKSSKEAALDLYKRSANGNYLPAYRYWAKLVEKDRPELAQRIRNVLSENSPNVQDSSDINVAQQKPSSVPLKPAQKGESAPKFLHREQWISQQRDKNWTIQIVAYRDEDQQLNFADQHELLKDGAYFMEANGDKAWYKLIVGSFSSKQEADAARNKLPASVKDEGPWLRQFKSVKAAIK